MASSILRTLESCAEEIAAVVHSGRHEGLSGQRPTQYVLDLAADEVARRVLVGAGCRVVSEESGVTGDGPVTVVVDPVDGSTNCDHGVPFYATSLAALDDGELVASVVMNLATGTVFAAERGAGATRDGARITASGRPSLAGGIIAFSGLPGRYVGWAQYRALGAASLEICLVADGSLDAYAVARRATLHPWDYLGGLLIAREAGAVADDYGGAELVTDEPVPRRFFVAGSQPLADELRDLGEL